MYFNVYGSKRSTDDLVQPRVLGRSVWVRGRHIIVFLNIQFKSGRPKLARWSGIFFLIA